MLSPANMVLLPRATSTTTVAATSTTTVAATVCDMTFDALIALIRTMFGDDTIANKNNTNSASAGATAATTAEDDGPGVMEYCDVYNMDDDGDAPSARIYYSAALLTAHIDRDLEEALLFMPADEAAQIRALVHKLYARGPNNYHKAGITPNAMHLAFHQYDVDRAYEEMLHEFTPAKGDVYLDEYDPAYFSVDATAYHARPVPVGEMVHSVSRCRATIKVDAAEWLMLVPDDKAAMVTWLMKSLFAVGPVEYHASLLLPIAVTLAFQRYNKKRAFAVAAPHMIPGYAA